MPPRVVMPRKRGYVHLRLVVAHVGPRLLMDTVTGEVRPHFYLLTEDGDTVDDIPEYVITAEPTIFVTSDPSYLLDVLRSAIPSAQLHYTLKRPRRTVGDVEVSYVKLQSFGINDDKHKQRRHQCWNPRDVTPTAHHKFITEATHEGLLQWATDVREWICEQDLEPRGAFAGYAAQLLRDSRFYPEPRRRVPKATNERARPTLPGNLTAIYVKPGPRTHDVTSIDHTRAHHRIVQQIELPCANTLFARGRYSNPECEQYWLKRSDPGYARAVTMPGLLHVGMYSHVTNRKAPFRLSVQDHGGFHRAFVYTNMIDFIEAHGSRIEGIYAAWTSNTCDTGLARYGEFAETQLVASDDNRKTWLKPLLHTTYGLLAARPRAIEVGHHLGTGGVPAQFLLGPRVFDVQMTSLKEWQPAITNVIQRGMIEAETQIRTLTLAEQLTYAGCQVTHIHTDGLHVEGQLPLLTDDWTVKELTNVTYRNSSSWVADEKACLPGLDEKRRQEAIDHHAGLLTNIGHRSNERGSGSDIQRTEKRTNVEVGRTHKHTVSTHNTNGGGKVATDNAEHIADHSPGRLGTDFVRIPARAAKRARRGTRKTAPRDMLPGVQPSSLDTLARVIPWGIYGKPKGVTVSTTETQQETGQQDQNGAQDASDTSLWVTVPKRGGSLSEEAIDQYHGFLISGTAPADGAFIVARDVNKETTARNKARSFGKRYHEKYGLVMTAHAIPEGDKYLSAVSVRVSDENNALLAKMREEYAATQTQDENASVDNASGDNADNENADTPEPTSGADAAQGKRTRSGKSKS